MKLAKIFADFNNVDKLGRVRLNTAGTMEDIDKNRIVLKDGLQVILDDNDEFNYLATVEFSQEEDIWVAKINASSD
jgi:hypothetical protein